MRADGSLALIRRPIASRCGTRRAAFGALKGRYRKTDIARPFCSSANTYDNPKSRPKMVA
jgi:hypothetical protein